MRLWAIPHSTNVERVALALAHKGLEAELVVVDPADRSPIVELSGQELVPVLEDEGRVIADSPAILRHLEERWPDPPLYPREPARREEVQTLVDWFNHVWKGPPNEIDAERRKPEPNEARIAELGAWLGASLDRFDALLEGRRHLAGEEFGVLDCIAFPFLKYGLLPPADGDEDTFHAVLAEFIPLQPRHENLRRWIEDVDERPRVS